MIKLCIILSILSLFSSRAERDSAARVIEMTEQQDKSYIFPTSDSLILFATDYYDRYGSKAERAKAHYLLGCVEADLFHRADAIYHLRLADRLNTDRESDFQALIYSRLGYLLSEHNLQEEAREVYEKSYQLALMRHDTIDLIYSSQQLGYVVEAWELAEEYAEVQDVRPTVLVALYDYYRAGDNDSLAEWAARECMSLVPHPMRTWIAMYNLGETLYYREEYDSARHLLEPILDIDHSYQLRANTANILENIALREGDTRQAAVYAELYKALQRSAYTTLETSNVLRQELLELETQERRSEGQKALLIISIVVLFVLLLIIAFLIYRRYRQHRLLKHSINEMQEKRQSLVQEDFESSAVYQKLQHIVTMAKENPFTKENLSAEDWQQLLVYADERYSGIATHLRQHHHLSEDELHICVLVLFSVPMSQIGHFVRGYTRNTIQLKARQIPLHAGAEKGTLLRHWLQEEIRVLSE